MCEQFMDVNEMIRDEDLIMQRANSPGNGVAAQYYSSRPVGNIRQYVANMVPSVRSRRPSARELNLLKRKAKISSKDQTKGWNKDGDTEAPQAQDIISPRGMCPDMSSSNKVTRFSNCAVHINNSLTLICICVFTHVLKVALF